LLGSVAGSVASISPRRASWRRRRGLAPPLSRGSIPPRGCASREGLASVIDHLLRVVRQ
jgi:hypothetical protein